MQSSVQQTKHTVRGYKKNPTTCSRISNRAETFFEQIKMNE